jgi:large subunit ribosomal protein L10
MRKQEKTALVEDLRAGFGRAKFALISEYQRMTAGESTDMRRKLRAARGELRVMKNTLLRRAVEGTDYASLAEKLGGPVGLILSFEDPVEMAKTVVGFKDLGDKFKIRGGVLEGKPLTAEEIQALATLPPRDVVIAQLLGLLQAPATQLVRLINEPGTMLARAIDAIGKKNGGPTDEAAPEAEAAPAADAAPAGR